MCLYYGESKVDLKRHLLEVHRDKERIKQLLEKEQNGEVSRKDVLLEIDLIRKEGIIQRNKTILAEGGGNDELESMRKTTGKKLICSKCRGTYKSKYFAVHKKKSVL
jgi:hypothetical protein